MVARVVVSGGRPFAIPELHLVVRSTGELRRFEVWTRHALDGKQRKAPTPACVVARLIGFGGEVQGQSFGVVTAGGPRLNLLRIEEELSAVHLRLANTVIECLPWQECVRRYDRPGTLFYLDPPYWETEGYGVEFPFAEYEAMAELMRGSVGRFVVSINDHPEIREVFAGFDLVPLQLDYTIGGGQGRGKKFGELIIKSWDDSQATLL